MSKSFDLLAYAAAHRYRVRNLHDGHPVPPTLPPPRGRRGRSSGYWAPADRMDAIVGRYGYVCDDGNGRIGWCLFAPTVRRLGFKLRKLAALGIVPNQEGDWEAAGDEDPARIEDILKVLEVARIPKHPGNLASLAPIHDAQRGTSARQTHAVGLPGTWGRPEAGNGSKRV